MFDPDALPIPDLGLRCPKCGYILAGLPEHRCPECGHSFTMDDFIPPGDFPLVFFNGREVAVTPEVVDLLRHARIPHMEIDAPVDKMLGFAVGPSKGAKLGVPREAYFEVLDLFRRHARGEPLPIGADPARPDWACPACGEENPGTFDLCWQCEKPREPAI